MACTAAVTRLHVVNVTTPPQPSTVSGRLVEALRATKTTQQALASRLGCATSSVSHWVNAHRGLSTGKIEDIAAALGVRAAWLGYGDGAMVDDVPSYPPPPPTRRRKPTPKAPGTVKTRTKRAPADVGGARKAPPRKASAPAVELKAVG